MAIKASQAKTKLVLKPFFAMTCKQVTKMELSILKMRFVLKETSIHFNSACQLNSTGGVCPKNKMIDGNWLVK